MDRTSFFQLFERISNILDSTCKKYDDIWLQRKRCVDTRFLVLFTLRLIVSHDKRGYACTLVEIFNNLLDINDSQQVKTISPSGICGARKKLDPMVFKELNSKVIELLHQYDKEPLLWNGHRLFAIDGSRFNLPRELIEDGYLPHGAHVHYPQGLVSAMYDVLTGIPYDFEISNDTNERTWAKTHLQRLQKGDVVLFDRGYFSFELLAICLEYDVYPVFRLSDHPGTSPVTQFWASDKKDEIILLEPSWEVKTNVKQGTYNVPLEPIKLRLVKYVINRKTYVLATTLLDKEKYSASMLRDVYHARWGIEEMIKVSKIITGVEDFHAKNERGIKQELYAHFFMLTLQKIIELESHRQLLMKGGGKTKKRSRGSSRVKLNQKNAFITLSNVLEKMLYSAVSFLKNGLSRVLEWTERIYQKVRPDRNYPRESKISIGKWYKSGMKSKKPPDICLAT